MGLLRAPAAALVGLVGLLLTAGMVPSQPQPPPNLLANPGFEEGAEAPKGWDLAMEGKGAGSAAWEATGGHSGARCLRVELKEPGDYWMADQTLPAGSAVKNRTYRLCGWYRATAEGVAHPTVYSLDANGQFLGAFEFSLPRAERWTFFDSGFRPLKGADHFRLQLRVQGSPGVVWYDDVTLCDAAPVAEMQQALAQGLEQDAATRAGWWWATLPNEGVVEVRFREVPEVQVALKLAGRLPVGSHALIHADVRFQTLGGWVAHTLPVMVPTAPDEAGGGSPTTTEFDLLNPLPENWNGVAALQVVADGIGDEARLLVGVEPTIVHRDGLVDARVGSPYQFRAGEPLPWGARFIGDTGAELDRLAAQNLPKHLRAILGARGSAPAVLALDGLTKRRPDQWRDDILNGALTPSGTVSLLCAGGETESLQCLYVPTVASPGKLTATMTPLRADGGAAIRPEACQVHLVEYVPFAGQWLPDPLLDQQPLEPPQHGPAVFWVTVSVPGNQKAGLYQGQLVMRSERGDEARADVRVRVPGFSLPKETHLNSSFWLFRAQIRRYFGLPDDPSPEVYGRYIDLVTSHRLSPIDVLEGPCSPLVKIHREADGTLSYDWSRWDDYLRRMMAGNANTIHAAWTHWMGGFFSERGPVEATDRADPEDRDAAQLGRAPPVPGRLPEGRGGARAVARVQGAHLCTALR